jgi:hypothetical protein
MAQTQAQKEAAARAEQERKQREQAEAAAAEQARRTQEADAAADSAAEDAEQAQQEADQAVAEANQQRNAAEAAAFQARSQALSDAQMEADPARQVPYWPPFTVLQAEERARLAPQQFRQVKGPSGAITNEGIGAEE